MRKFLPIGVGGGYMRGRKLMVLRNCGASPGQWCTWASTLKGMEPPACSFFLYPEDQSVVLIKGYIYIYRTAAWW